MPAPGKLGRVSHSSYGEAGLSDEIGLPLELGEELPNDLVLASPRHEVDPWQVLGRGRSGRTMTCRSGGPDGADSPLGKPDGADFPLGK